MGKISKNTKDMNKVWTEKQKDLGKTYTSYYVGGTIFAVAALLAVIYFVLL